MLIIGGCLSCFYFVTNNILRDLQNPLSQMGNYEKFEKSIKRGRIEGGLLVLSSS